MSEDERLSLASALRLALAGDLPGKAVQELMLPASRRGLETALDPRPSAVLVPIVEREGGPTIILIERAKGGQHGGEIAFPGGRRESGDADSAATALREAREEIGLDARSVEILGFLSPLTIAVSRYLVEPVVGFVAAQPRLVPNLAEVAAILEVPLADLLAPESRHERTILVRGEELIVPCYIFGSVLVWGATAMILSELRYLLADFFSPAPSESFFARSRTRTFVSAPNLNPDGSAPMD